ncbi:MAG: hypothetical protein FJ026_05075 [Chloroflexi bacterium]|nr:hypothetical protein [Chloroflexota bacterium]
MKLGLRHIILAICSLLLAGCSLCQIPGNIQRSMEKRAQRYPWVREPVDEEHKARLCVALGLETSHPLCQTGSRVSAGDVVTAVAERFPVNKTRYKEVAQALDGFPVCVEESRLPRGEVTGRSYVYLLTQFEGFCVYFDVDLETNIVDRIGNTKAPGIFDGPIPEKCGPALRGGSTR